MAILNQKKILNVIPGISPQLTVHCSQSDEGSTVEFELYAGSVPFEPDGTASVQGIRKDGTGFGPEAVTLDGSTATVTLSTAMTGVAGPALCEITITETGGSVSTANFALLVEEAVFPDGPLVDNSVDVYQQILQYVQSFPASAAADATAKVAAEATARAAAVSAEASARQAADTQLQTEISGLQNAVGGPNVAATVAAMTDTSKVYVYTGSETGYTAGNWYYWNGSAWVSGGVYNSTAVQTDPTLSVAGMAADAAACGELKHDLQKYNCANLFVDGTYASGTNRDVTFTWNGRTCAVSGTANGGVAGNVIYNSTTELPDNLFAGETYQVRADISGSNIRFDFYKYISGSTTPSLITQITESGIYNLPIEQDAVGLRIRLSVGSGTTASGTARFDITNCKTNEELTLSMENVNSAIAAVESIVSANSEDLENLQNLNAIRVFTDYANTSDINNGITYAWSDSVVGRCSVSGTASANSLNNLFGDLTAMPDGFVVGGKYWVAFNSTDTGVFGEIFCWNSSEEAILTLTITEDQGLIIPSGTVGMTIRLRVLKDTAITGTATVNFNINSAPSNAYLAEHVGTNNYYSFTTNENTYTIEATPEITTDTNNYLAASGDNTDRTADIQAVLAATGVCHLGPGNFYTTGVTLTAGQTLDGCGKATRLYLANSVSNGAAVTLDTDTTLKDLDIRGTASVTVNSTVGTRHGVMIAGNATGAGDHIPTRINISGLYISRLNGGAITLYDTGLSTPAAVLVSDVHIWGCDAGINISYFSEFNQFVNVTCRGCYYGCVDNGGNNIFSNCNFSGNTVGLLMDNSNNQSPNNSHGGFANCIFDHSGGNNGVGIKIMNNNAGEVFTGCQVFYSDIEVEDSSGIVFDGFNFGNAEDITITGGGAVTFANCMFGTAPTITISDNTHVVFDKCYTRAGAAVTA